MTFRLATTAAALILGATLSTAATAQSPAYRYSGSHAGGPADALIPNGTPRAVSRVRRPLAYRYSGSHAGGPANALNTSGQLRPVVRPVRSPAYRYSGSHAGGPANGLRY